MKRFAILLAACGALVLAAAPAPAINQITKGSATVGQLFDRTANKGLPTAPLTIATTGNSDTYVLCPVTGSLGSVDMSGTDALAQHASNYVTFSITNLGQAGAGTTAMLAATDANTTKTTTGSAIGANTKRSLTLNGTLANLNCTAGDRLLIRAAATGTLANTITNTVYMLRFANVAAH